MADGESSHSSSKLYEPHNTSAELEKVQPHVGNPLEIDLGAHSVRKADKDGNSYNKVNQMSPAIYNKTSNPDDISCKVYVIVCYRITVHILLLYVVIGVTYLLFFQEKTSPFYSDNNENSFAHVTLTTNEPTVNPTYTPSFAPTISSTSTYPTTNTSIYPTTNPSIHPTTNPTTNPTIHPTTNQTEYPTVEPTHDPTAEPTSIPTLYPSIPDGAVVQVKWLISHTRASPSNFESWIEPSGDYRLSITPKYRDSSILVTYNFAWNGNGLPGGTSVVWAAARGINGGTLSREVITSSGSSVQNGQRWQISGTPSERQNGWGDNDPNLCNWITYDAPNTTDTVTYGLHMIKDTGAQTILIGQSINEWTTGLKTAWTIPVTIIAMEIRN